jgi:hypothetical protein
MKNAQATCDQLKFYNLHIVDNQLINENEVSGKEEYVFIFLVYFFVSL